MPGSSSWMPYTPQAVKGLDNTFTYPVSDVIVRHTFGMIVDIVGTDIRNAYKRVRYESPVAKKRKVTTKYMLVGMSSLILVSCFFFLRPSNCSNNSKSLAVILVKFQKAAQLFIITSPSMFSSLFQLYRKLAVQRFRLRFLLRPIIMIAAAISADCSALEDIFPHTNECWLVSGCKMIHSFRVLPVSLKLKRKPPVIAITPLDLRIIHSPP
jgi:hypothetical protein